MSQLDIRKTYVDGDTPTASDIDNIVDSLETFINTTKLTSDNIQAAGITTAAIFEDGSITGGKFQSESITTAKLEDGSVGESKFADNAVLTSYRSTALNEAYSSGGTASATTGSGTTTGESVTITSTGLPVLIMLVPASSSTSYIYADNNALNWSIVEGATTLHGGVFGWVNSGTLNNIKGPPSIVCHLLQPSAGAHTYTIKISAGTSSASGTVGYVNCKLYAVEVF